MTGFVVLLYIGGVYDIVIVLANILKPPNRDRSADMDEPCPELVDGIWTVVTVRNESKMRLRVVIGRFFGSVKNTMFGNQNEFHSFWSIRTAMECLSGPIRPLAIAVIFDTVYSAHKKLFTAYTTWCSRSVS